MRARVKRPPVAGLDEAGPGSPTPATTGQSCIRPAQCRAIRVAALFLVTALPAAAQSTDPAALDLQLAREEAVVVTTANRTFRGLLDGTREGRLFIRHITEGGEVGYSFAPEDVREFNPPGTKLANEAIDLWERRELDDALPLLEAIGRQRLRYLPLLNREQRQPLFALVAAANESGDARAAIAYVSLLRPHVTTDREAAELRDAELNAYLNLGLTDETRVLAEAWCASADAIEGSALGWKILARLEFDAGNFDRALWIALQPIVSSTYLPLKELDRCYVLAIASADALDDPATALRLYREMNARGLAWPGDRKFNAVALRYATLSASTDSASELPTENQTTAATSPPIDSEMLTFGEIRKLVASRGSTSQ